ncbi:hypothetical protein [Streptomyces spiramyceticus]|uniref:hypothetical protein n=1 Tax=Streptomyces spiramyceticus TaxID=299717 RepID=UPI00237AE510|nr:hypothetical protein [Streptomyces spiramyceticus]
MVRSPSRSQNTYTEPSPLLGIYLNDHLAGSVAGLELARRMAKAHAGSAVGSALRPIAAEIAQDRAALLEIMSEFGIPARRYKVCAGWLTEKVTRLKSNGRLVRRSPLSTMVELETLRLGVEGKAAAWKALRLLTDGGPRLDPEVLDLLLERAEGQIQVLEELRLQQAEAAFRGA